MTIEEHIRRRAKWWGILFYGSASCRTRSTRNAANGVGHGPRAQLPAAQPPSPSRAQPGAGRASWSLVARTVASRAFRCASVSQTRTPTRLPAGTSVWHVTFESAFRAFDAAAEGATVEPTAVVVPLAALASTIIAPVAAAASAVGAFTVDAWSGETEAQAHSRTLASRVVGTICLEAWMDGISVTRGSDDR